MRMASLVTLKSKQASATVVVAVPLIFLNFRVAQLVNHTVRPFGASSWQLVM